MADPDEELVNEALAAIQENNGSCTLMKLQRWLNISEPTAKAIVQELFESGELTITDNWDYELTDTPKQKPTS